MIVIATNWSDINDNGRSACQNVSVGGDTLQPARMRKLVLIRSVEPILAAWTSLDNILEMLEKLAVALSGYWGYHRPPFQPI